MHERQAIREALVSALVAGATPAGDRVFKTRLAPMRDAELPAISVYTLDEETDQASRKTSPRELKRSVSVAIEAWAKAGTNVDDTLDDLALAIETAMDADQNLGATAFDSVLTRTEIGLKLDGDRPMGCAHLEYEVTYHTDLRVTEPVDDFDTMAASYRVNGAGEDDQAEDLVTDIHE